jgi:hypothetical protein
MADFREGEVPDEPSEVFKMKIVSGGGPALRLS